MHIEHRIRFIFFPSIFHRDLRQDPRINYSTPLNIPWLRAGNGPCVPCRLLANGAAGTRATLLRPALAGLRRGRHRWANREVEWSFWEKRHRRQSREGSGEEAGTLPTFKWAGAHESMWTTSEFQSFRSLDA